MAVMSIIKKTLLSYGTEIPSDSPLREIAAFLSSKLKPGFHMIVTVGDILRHIGDASPISRQHMETITVLMIWKPGFKLISDSARHVAKLHAYGFSREALTLINDCFKNRQQKVKVNGSFSSWKSVTRGVPQGSVLGPLLFNIYINDLLLFIQNSDICNYADDATIYACDKSLDNISHRLETDCSVALEWFADNFMKLNADKCHLLVLGQRCDDPVTVRIGNADVVNSSEEKLLGVQIDSRLSFDNHVSKLCQKASNKLYALARISPYMDQSKLRALMRAFITSQFQYCPLI